MIRRIAIGISLLFVSFNSFAINWTKENAADQAEKLGNIMFTSGQYFLTILCLGAFVITAYKIGVKNERSTLLISTLISSIVTILLLFSMLE